MDASAIDNTDTSFLDLSHISRSILHMRFQYDLPAFFSTMTTSTLSSIAATSPKKDSDYFNRKDNLRADC